MDKNNYIWNAICTYDYYMYLSIDIQDMAQPVVNDTKRVSFVVRFLHFVKNKMVTKYNNHLTTFNLALEGALNRIDALSIEKSTSLLSETKGIIVSFENIEADLFKANYLDSDEVKQNIKYSLECLYKLESKLHKNVYKNLPIIETDKELKEGFSKMKSASLDKLLSC